LKQREQYQAGLKTAEAAKALAEVPVDRGISMHPSDGKMPWALAEAMIPVLRSQRMVTTSVSCYIVYECRPFVLILV
jgi:hypothetical protein